MTEEIQDTESPPAPKLKPVKILKHKTADITEDQS